MTTLTTEKEIISREKFKIDQIIEIQTALFVSTGNEMWYELNKFYKDLSLSRGEEMRETVKLENDSKKESKLKEKWAKTFKKVVEHYKGVIG